MAVATAKHLGVRLTVAGWRQVAIAIGDEHLRRGVSNIWKQDQDEAIEGESDGEGAPSLEKQSVVQQAAHGKQAANLHYAIDAAFFSRLGPDLISAYSKASQA